MIQSDAYAVSKMPGIEAVHIVSGKGQWAISEGRVEAKILTTDQSTYLPIHGRLPDFARLPPEKDRAQPKDPVLNLSGVGAVEGFSCQPAAVHDGSCRSDHLVSGKVKTKFWTANSFVHVVDRVLLS